MRTPTENQTQKAIQAKLDRACSIACDRIPIDLFKGIPAVARKARELFDAGADDSRLATELRVFVESIRAA